MIFILRSFMSADQVAKLADQLILLYNTFLNLVVKHKEKLYTHYVTERLTNKVVRKQLAKLNYILLLEY